MTDKYLTPIVLAILRDKLEMAMQAAEGEVAITPDLAEAIRYALKVCEQRLAQVCGTCAFFIADENEPTGCSVLSRENLKSSDYCWNWEADESSFDLGESRLKVAKRLLPELWADERE